MRTLIILVVGLLAVGCSTLRDRVIGTYESRHGANSLKIIILENGVIEGYQDGEKEEDAKWSIVGKEVHVEEPNNGGISVARINPDGSLTATAMIKNGKREDLPKEDQFTFKKIK